jgi:CRISPR/Cas system CMR-associated protein Cmr5 small subunit
MAKYVNLIWLSEFLLVFWKTKSQNVRRENFLKGKKRLWKTWENNMKNNLLHKNIETSEIY